MTPSHQAHATAPHPQTRSRRAHARAGGLIAAALLTALFGSVVGWFVWKGQNSAPRDPTPTPGAAEIPDAAVLPSQPGTAQLGSLGENAGPFMQFADRKDPTRVAGEIVADRAQPLDGRRYRLDRPRAWNFLRDGRTLYIEADTGRASFAEQGAKGRPEEATLVGHVVLKLFAGRPDGSRPDPAKDPAIYTATMDELRFDSALGRVTVPSPLHVEGEAVAFRGKGVTLLFSELTERIEHLRVDQTEFIEFRSPSRGTRVTEATPPALPILNPSLFAASLAFAQVTPQPAAEVEYQLTATDSVRLAQGTRSVAGQRLDGWIRLVDNQLPDRTRSRMPNPSAPPRQPTPDTPRPAADLPAAPPGEPAPSTEPAPAPVPTTASGQDPVRLTFDGPLEASPLKQPSAELAHNDAFVRITAPNTGGVVASDAKSGAEASGTLIEYGATREDVAIGAAEPFGVTLSLPGTGVLVGQRIEFSQLSGSAQVRGPGMLAQGDPLLLPPDESERSIRWSQSGEFTFNQAQSGNSRQLVRALLVGDVRGEDKGGSFGAEQLQAEFTPVEGSSSRLTRTLLAGHARAGTGDDASLEAETIDVKFAQGDRPSDATPKRLLAMGNVKGRRGEDRLSAHELTADLAKLADGSVGATQVSAIGDASYFGPNDIVAKADRIEADPVAKVADLSGPNTTITRGESVITGSHIRLLSDSRRLQVLTPGTFAHRQPGTDGGPDAVARVSWWRSMTFDDLRGEVECLGSAHAELLRGENAKDTMDAERVVLLLA
ncbi:MAG: LptA/OstA family protein, partial [Phycisphaerales bacterium]